MHSKRLVGLFFRSWTYYSGSMGAIQSLIIIVFWTYTARPGLSIDISCCRRVLAHVTEQNVRYQDQEIMDKSKDGEAGFVRTVHSGLQ